MNQTLVAITGASSGIGEAFARRLAAEHDLLLIARRQDRLAELARELSSGTNSRVEILGADLTLEQDLERVVERVGGDSRLVLLVNNAGFGSRGRFWETEIKTQDDMHKLHVMATMRLSHAALGNMVPRDYGAIINVASVAAFVRSAGSTSYSATKTWINAFTEGLYLELKAIGSNVTVQALCPGFTYSEFHDRLAVQRERLASRAFWHRAEDVVEASINGLERRKLFVIPGWRYQWIVAAITKLPTGARLLVESAVTQRRRKQYMASGQPSKQIQD